MSQDTIFALSSGPPPSAIAVIRMSGPRVRFGLETLVGRVPSPRQMTRARISEPAEGRLIDVGLAVFFPGPASVTGQDLGELHVHGGRAVVAVLLGALASLEGFRLAERGEFTRRALEAGKIDLVEAEGLADLVLAETEMQRRQALRQVGGDASEIYERWRERLVVARGMIEAEIDFAEGEDLPASVADRAWEEIGAVRKGISLALADAFRGERLREGIEVVILGPPNVGKSSLLNWFAQRDAAIVSPEPGTTRDLIEVGLDLGGFPLTLTDTAGLREADGLVEREGVRRALARAVSADVVLLLDEVGRGATSDASGLPPTARVLRIGTKADLVDSAAEQKAGFDVVVSTKTGAGLPRLLVVLTELVEREFGGREAALVTRHRHVEALRRSAAALERSVIPGLALEIVAEELRAAADGLARVVGRIDVEEWLDVIFSEFCIGK